MRNILVTGGAGYIGSHACKALRAAGYLPVTLDSLVTGWADALASDGFRFPRILVRPTVICNLAKNSKYV